MGMEEGGASGKIPLVDRIDFSLMIFVLPVIPPVTRYNRFVDRQTTRERLNVFFKNLAQNDDTIGGVKTHSTI